MPASGTRQRPDREGRAADSFQPSVPRNSGGVGFGAGFFSDKDRRPIPLDAKSFELEDFIAKPFRRRELVGCVFELLQRDAAGGEPVKADLEYCCA